jgi:AraC-like DNA-binding protein
VNQIIPTADTPLVHPTYVRMLCATLRRHGVDVATVLQAAGIGPWSEIATSEQLLDHRHIQRLVAEALQANGRPGLGLEVCYGARRLKGDGTSYQTLLGQTRQQRALWYLSHTHQTVEEIAGRLGYTDTTNFSRTFRRRFGKAPSDVRRADLGGAENEPNQACVLLRRRTTVPIMPKPASSMAYVSGSGTALTVTKSCCPELL